MTASYTRNSVNFPFRDTWTITDRQKGLLTCTSISPSGVWLASGSQDGAIIFVDHKAGTLVGVLDLESKFYATTAIWRSDTVLVFGCSNGVVYHLDFEHKVDPITLLLLIYVYTNRLEPAPR
jgi:WD40 repeat protein